MIPGALAHAGPVAVGRAGSRDLADLQRDVAGLVGRLAGLEARGPTLITTVDRYAFVVACLAAWQVERRVLLPRNLQPDTVDQAKAVCAAVLGPGGLDPLGQPAQGSPCRLPPADQVIVTVQTSGSTGAPRDVDKTAAQLLGEAAVLQGLDGSPGGLGSGAVLSTVPPMHIYGLLFGVLLPLVAGVPFVRETPLHPEAVAATARETGATVLVGTPAHLRGLEILEPGDLGPLVRVFSSGAPLAAATGQMLAERFDTRVLEVLGSTETGGIAWRDAGGEPAPWTPLPGVEVGANVEGRLQLRSPFLEPGATQPLVADDRIELVGAGRFQHLGRADDVVKVGGRRVSLRHMENALLALDGIDDAAIHAEPSTSGRGIRLRAAVATTDSTWTVTAVRKALSRTFDPVTLPRMVRLAPSLPREANGKLPRDRLGAWLDDVPSGMVAFPDHDPDGFQVTLAVTVPPSAPHFAGHFPGEPIFPAVAQLDAVVMDAVRRVWPALGEPRNLRRLKFRRRMNPGATAELKLERTAGEAPRIDFELRSEEGPFASGTLLFEGGTDG